MNIIKRWSSPTPRFFKRLRTLGLIMAIIGGGIISSPVKLPIIIAETGGYMTLIGGIISAMSQITVDESRINKSKVKSKPDE